ncbi:PEP-CTERM sorting domain-containing protein [Pseudoduganella chitinolytica]|uniref:PEP-CTERM sorting domain-containing protein n=1 Tax=Pseudoduganella chitinolytica TaxID=34070 RepID=A0ABY8BAL1_9BURK|nr:PEP-CTERM sorting domain-containing protein [Pseudoduganella chitinolytica]WEF32163.1 PEP-CTERM sorting domain-containing protein [Pseudoduganella chitinolytica]
MRKLLLLPSLMLVFGAAHAGTWTFTYQGFEREGTFDPDFKLSGSFSGDDLDADNVIELNELASLVLDGRVYVGTSDGSGIAYTADSFNYALTGRLQFSTRYLYRDEAIRIWGATVSGDRIERASYHLFTGEGYSHTAHWTDQTTFTISPPPVPEPASFAMLGAGALLLGARQLRQRRPCRS